MSNQFLESLSKEEVTEIVFLLDRSGSMYHLVDETIGGFNGFVESQKKQQEDKALLTTVLFDHAYEVLHDGVDIQDVEPITQEQYYVRGYTALLDAIGKTILEVDARVKKNGAKVVFVITTDGEDNSSKEFTWQQIKNMVESHANWQFLFLGANIDAITTAGNLGIKPQYASQYTAQKDKVNTMYGALSYSIQDYRSSGKIGTDWSNSIE